jgi:hypothetical protein
MDRNFQIAQELGTNEAKTLIKGFGLPLVKRAFYNTKAVDEGDKPDGVSILGTPLFGTLFIEKPFYTTFEYDEVNQKYSEIAQNLSENKSIGGVKGVFVEGVIIDVNQPRNIVTTEIAGMDGDVTEFINNGAYRVTIRGYFTGPTPDTFPDTDVRALNTYIKAPVPLRMTNVYLNDYFGITDLIVLNASFAQEEGVRNVQFFTMECKSDTPFEILETRI